MNNSRIDWRNHENHVPVARHQPSILILAALIVVVAFIALRGVNVPLLSNPKVSVAIVLVLGFAMCAQGGLGYVGAAGLTPTDAGRALLRVHCIVWRARVMAS